MNIKHILFRITHWETWSFQVKYIPLAPFWLWYCLRSRSLWFFTPSNPTLTFGGFEGESKKEMYEQLPAGAYPATIYISPGEKFSCLEERVKRTFSFPVAAKPDVGMMGFLFRKISNFEELKAYHEKMPVDYLIQEHIDLPIEVSVFYYRYPGESTGTITGFLRKESLSVTGDGRSSLLELMLAYPRVRYRIGEMKAKHKDKLNEVLPPGQIFPLSQALNLSRGGKMVSLKHEKDDRLTAVFDAISRHAKHFYYGRYDVKCSSIEDLKEGRNFSILEYNGSGAEPHHIYGDNKTLLQAYRILMHHWKALYTISRINYRNGVPYWNFKEGWDFLKNAKKHFRMLKKLDTEFPTS